MRTISLRIPWEDRVQDGLVLFASVQDREVQLPMQAELYNRAGELIWQQTVLDDRLPPGLKLKRPRRFHTRDVLEGIL